MNTLLLRICFLLIMLSGFSGSVSGVRVGYSLHKTDRKEQICASADKVFARKDGSRSHDNSFASFISSGVQNVVCSRTVKHVPTHGGKSGRTLGRLSSDISIHLSRFFTILLHHLDTGSRIVVASPRHYYVIALRRILC